MDKIIISGNSKLFGSIKVNGSKNAALPILAASLLSDKDLQLTNLPDLVDIYNMKKLLIEYGVKINENNNLTICNAKNISNKIADYETVRKMRASILLLGPLLSRFKKAIISLEKGQKIDITTGI